MTTEDFNKKHSKYLEAGHYGLAIHNEDAINYLDKMFDEKLIHIPNFKYYQIKTKFGSCRFYCTGIQVPNELIAEIEANINNILFNKT